MVVSVFCFLVMIRIMFMQFLCVLVLNVLSNYICPISVCVTGATSGRYLHYFKRCTLCCHFNTL